MPRMEWTNQEWRGRADGEQVGREPNVNIPTVFPNPAMQNVGLPINGETRVKCSRGMADVEELRSGALRAGGLGWLMDEDGGAPTRLKG